MTGICWAACKHGMWNGCKCPDQPKMGINCNRGCRTTDVTSCRLSIGFDSYHALCEATGRCEKFVKYVVDNKRLVDMALLFMK